MKDFTIHFIALVLTLVCLCLISLKIYILFNHETKDKQHLKLIRKGCCQFRINEYTNEVKHFEGCENLAHFDN